MDYLAFDQLLREGRNLTDFPGIPLGYVDFVVAFNTGTAPDDRRRLSTYLTSSTGEHITRSDNPVFLRDFHITPEHSVVSLHHIAVVLAKRNPGLWRTTH